MPAASRIPGSFRDPSGFVYTRGGIVLRQVNPCYAAHYDRLIASGLYDDLVNRGLMLPHREAGLEEAYEPGAFKVLVPEPLEFISYPYEWCFSQLKDTALALLSIQRRALASGMSLKDASAYNFQLHRGRPMLIDTLSFETYAPGSPWVAYRQFCQHFLAPLLLMSKVEMRLGQLLRAFIDGIPLDMASRLLPRRTLLSLPSALHIHLHAFLQKRHGTRIAKPQKFSLRSFQGLLFHLERAIESLKPRNTATEWHAYYENGHNYGDPGMSSKTAALQDLLASASGQVVWDLGANDGRLSQIALDHGAKTVVAWDNDATAVERRYCDTVRRRQAGLFPLLLDLTNPSPGIGWANEERASLAQRGPADTLLMLGLVHHLAISNNLPFSHIARLCGSLGRRLIIEWIPREDSQVQRILSYRADNCVHYQEAQFRADFEHQFRVVRRTQLEGTCRTLLVLESRAA